MQFFFFFFKSGLSIDVLHSSYCNFLAILDFMVTQCSVRNRKTFVLQTSSLRNETPFRLDAEELCDRMYLRFSFVHRRAAKISRRAVAFPRSKSRYNSEGEAAT